MRSALIVLASAAMLLALSTTAHAQPANDACANAITITDGSVNGTTVNATNDGGGTCGASGASPDVWYRYIAPLTGQMTASLCTNGAFAYDTVLGIWSGCPGSGSEIACNDDFCGLQSSISINATSGQTYYIRVSGYSGNSGTFTLTVSTTQL